MIVLAFVLCEIASAPACVRTPTGGGGVGDLAFWRLAFDGRAALRMSALVPSLPKITMEEPAACFSRIRS